MTLERIMTSLSLALTGVIDGTTLAIFAYAGVVIALAVKLGSGIVKSLR
jgi:hypothetical protein